MLVPVSEPDTLWKGTPNRVPAPRRAAAADPAPPCPMDTEEEGASVSVSAANGKDAHAAAWRQIQPQLHGLQQHPDMPTDEDDDVQLISSIPSPHTAGRTGAQTIISLLD